jgi:primary-amine oxidase
MTTLTAEPAAELFVEAPHPLEPLTPQEMERAVDILHRSGKLAPRARFVKLELCEPLKEVVLGFRDGMPFEREAFAIVLDAATGQTFEAVVSLTQGQVSAYRHIPGVQPSLMMDEFTECEELLRSDPDFQAALRLRGVTDFSLVQIDTWSAGFYDAEEERTRRVVRPLIYVSAQPDDNFYARPVEGLLAVVDLNELKVVRIEDCGVVPVPAEAGEYAAKHIRTFRSGLKPLDIVQPEGPSFTVSGHEVKWQNWSFRVGFTSREGLVLHTVGYEDGGRVRPIIYRAALAEMTVPYGDPGESQYRKNAFDVGEYGMGMLANSLELGCDCLGVIHYFDGYICDSRGVVVHKPNVICMHEEDYGVLWKHKQTDVRRSRRLVVSFIATVGNYDYAYYWYFYQDGSIQYEVKLTGILSTGALPPDTTSKYGTLLAPGLYAPNHQHFMNVRLDMMVDGPRNAVYEVHSEAEPRGPANPHGNAFIAKHTLLQSELEAQQLIDPLAGRYWEIVNHGSRNRLGQPVAYKLIPGENVRMFAHPDSIVARRAAYMSKHLWVTPYEADEKFPAGDYPNQHQGGDGLPKWTAANRSIVDTNVVVWYTLGSNHIARVEEWPIMPVCTIGFMLKPAGFFDRNPAIDLPEPHEAHCHA